MTPYRLVPLSTRGQSQSQGVMGFGAVRTRAQGLAQEIDQFVGSPRLDERTGKAMIGSRLVGIGLECAAIARCRLLELLLLGQGDAQVAQAPGVLGPDRESASR